MCTFVQKDTLSISFTYKYILVENRATFSRFAQPFKIVDRTVAHDLNWICFFCLVVADRSCWPFTLKCSTIFSFVDSLHCL